VHGQPPQQNGAITIISKTYLVSNGINKSQLEHQWKPVGDAGAGTVPDAHDPSRSHQPFMLTTDLSLRVIQYTRKIFKTLFEKSNFNDAFARAWFKLTTEIWDQSSFGTRSS
jgi:catalase (peroxidase I)